MPKLTLALFHDAARTGDVLAWINRFDRGSANNTVSWTDRVIHAGAERCSGRAQLHCLTLSDRELARNTIVAWCGLRRTCYHQPRTRSPRGGIAR